MNAKFLYRKAMAIQLFLFAGCAGGCLLAFYDAAIGRTACLILGILQLAALILFSLYQIDAHRTARIFLRALSEELDGKISEEELVSQRGFVSETAYCQILARMKERLEEEYSQQLLNREAKLNVLQSQINPHFLYNTLDSIRSDVQEAGLKVPAQMLEQLAAFFRYSISEKKIIISLQEELKNVDTYMNIMRYRFGSRFVLIKYVDTEDHSLMDFQMPKMLLQPLIENAINHGLESRLGDGLITLYVGKTDKHAEILVQDNGVGMDAETLQKIRTSLNSDQLASTPQGKKGGLALINVDHRLKLYFGPDYGLSISSAEGIGTEIRILMPRSGGIADGRAN